MNAPFRIAIAAALIVAAAVGGIYVLRPPGDLSGGPTISPSPTPTEPLIGTATLTAAGCTFEPGPAPLKPGLLRIDLRNDTERAAGFDLLRLREGTTYAELAAFMREEDARVKAGEPYLGAMAFGSVEATWDLAPRETFPLIFDARAGTHGLICVRLSSATVVANDTALGYYLFGPLEVR